MNSLYFSLFFIALIIGLIRDYNNTLSFKIDIHYPIMYRDCGDTIHFAVDQTVSLTRCKNWKAPYIADGYDPTIDIVLTPIN